MPGHHFLTTDSLGECAMMDGFALEGVVCDVCSVTPGGVAPQGMSPFYRFYNSSNGDHLYTLDSNGEGAAGYTFEKIACYVFNAPTTGAVALLRWYCHTIADHVYTIDGSGEDPRKSNPPYVLEQIACYVYPPTALAISSASPPRLPLFRWFQSGKALGNTPPHTLVQLKYLFDRTKLGLNSSNDSATISVIFTAVSSTGAKCTFTAPTLSYSNNQSGNPSTPPLVTVQNNALSFPQATYTLSAMASFTATNNPSGGSLPTFSGAGYSFTGNQVTLYLDSSSQVITTNPPTGS